MGAKYTGIPGGGDELQCVASHPPKWNQNNNEQRHRSEQRRQAASHVPVIAQAALEPGSNYERHRDVQQWDLKPRIHAENKVGSKKNKTDNCKTDLKWPRL